MENIQGSYTKENHLFLFMNFYTIPRNGILHNDLSSKKSHSVWIQVQKYIQGYLYSVSTLQ